MLDRTDDPTRRNGREPYAECGRAARLVLARAVAADLSRAELRVAWAAVTLLTSYSRRMDTLSAAQIGAAAGLVNERRVRAALRRLHDLGVLDVVQRPGRRSLVAIDDEPGHPLDDPGPPGERAPRSPGGPTSEKYPEKTSSRACSRARPEARASDGAVE